MSTPWDSPVAPFQSNANPNDPAQQMQWASEKSSEMSRQSQDYANYLRSPERRKENVGFFANLANRTQDNGQDYLSQLMRQGMYGSGNMSSKFLESLKRKNMGSAFTAAGEQTRSDQGAAQGWLGLAANANNMAASQSMERGKWDDAHKPMTFGDFAGGFLGKVVGAGVEGFTGGMGVGAMKGGYDWMKGLFA